MNQETTRTFYLACQSNVGSKILKSTAHVAFCSSNTDIPQLSPTHYDISSPMLFSKDVSQQKIEVGALFEMHTSFERLPIPVLKNHGIAGPICDFEAATNTFKKDSWVLYLTLNTQCEDKILVESVFVKPASRAVTIKNSQSEESKITG